MDLIGKTTLKQSLAVFEAADIVLCPDSGPAHMATAVLTPVLGLYASSNPDRTGPYVSRQLTVNRYPDAVRRFLGKSVDEVRWGQRVRDPEVMSLITVADVTRKLDNFYDLTPGARLGRGTPAEHRGRDAGRIDVGQAAEVTERANPLAAGAAFNVEKIDVTPVC